MYIEIHSQANKMKYHSLLLSELFFEAMSYFESIIQTNLIGIWYVMKAVANHMEHNNIHWSIINICSVNGGAIPAKVVPLTVLAAVIHLTKTLVGEPSRHKIRINCISSGWIRMPMNDQIRANNHSFTHLYYVLSMSWGGKSW